jgi:kinesin family protein 11
LDGFNCTIFAYGQTGTGKTYTMSGDITDIQPTPDAAGIVPRVLFSLFGKLGEDEGELKSEHSVKCSFIELYNEELRDLLSPDDATKLKIYDEANKSGRASTMVQGMEETHIKSASNGIKLLRDGSHKRQVAATKCNDLSSRSHTVFTITVYTKRTTDTGEDYVSAGKLNLVDLAGSENIQRSGAENKRAAEAGLINKSLLTLGRVINALVDKSSHIPYRESKLTRLLQDSLGGRTKTCIIATLSPAKSNLEETISTLDYAFRAKNIRNKPQVNQTVSKKTLFREFTAEIEKLKSELIATRQRNGVYLTAERYEEITTESESRKILSEEQRDKIETMETNLRNKVQELFALTTNFQSAKKSNEQTRMMLEGTKSILEKTEIVLGHTKTSLAEETYVREAHEATEGKLAGIGQDLLGTIGTTTDHIDRLHSKLRRRSELQSTNRSRWAESRTLVSGTTLSVEERIEALRTQQEDLLSGLSGRMQSFVTDELEELRSSKAFLQEKADAFERSEAEVNAQNAGSKEDLNKVLEEIRTLREDVKEKVGTGLSDLSTAAGKISAGISTELDAFHGQLQDSYVTLGREFKTIFEDLIKRMNEQQNEAQRLRAQITSANTQFVEASQQSQTQLQQAVEEERQTAATERATLLANITSLINDSATSQEARMTDHLQTANKRVKTSEEAYLAAQQVYGNGMDAWNGSSQALIEQSVQSRESIKTRLKSDWASANDHTSKITETTHAVHGETVRIVDDQMAQMDNQLVALDEIVARVKAQNEEHHKAHTSSLAQLASNVQQSYQSIGAHFDTSYDRTKALDTDMQERTTSLQETLPALEADSDIREPLRLMRDELTAAQIAEYQATGETPAKTHYAYPHELPRTEARENLLDRMRGGTGAVKRPASPVKSPGKRSPRKMMRTSPTRKGNAAASSSSPIKQHVFADTPPVLKFPQQPSSVSATRPMSSHSNTSTTLREVDVNVVANAGVVASNSIVEKEEEQDGLDSKTVVDVPPLLKRMVTHPTPTSQVFGGESKLPMKRRTVAGLPAGEGRENLPEVTTRRRLRPRSGD